MFSGVAGLLGSSKADLKRALALIAEGRRKDAFPALARAAKAGLAEAEYQIARSYLEGAGVPGSASEGARWLERAAEQGLPEAQSLLAAFYAQGIPSMDGTDDALAGTQAASLFTATAAPPSRTMRRPPSGPPRPPMPVWPTRRPCSPI